MMNATKTQLIIDCDAGTDDAQAIMMALAHPHADLVAVTTVFGNAPLDNTYINVLRVLKVCGRQDIPVYKGCAVSLTGKAGIGDSFHGNDGFGDVFLPDIDPVEDVVETEHAAAALARLASEQPGEYTLVALGPLTNVALALHLDHKFGENLKDCFIMGGNSDGKGNITPTAEFNIYSDPEAAHFVFTKFIKPFYLVDLSVSLKYSWTWDEYASFLKVQTTKARFIETIERKVVVNMKTSDGRLYCMWDQLAVAAAIDNSVIAEVKHVKADVELTGQLTNGQLVIDWRSNESKNVILITHVYKEKYDEMIYDAVRN